MDTLVKAVEPIVEKWMIAEARTRNITTQAIVNDDAHDRGSVSIDVLNPAAVDCTADEIIADSATESDLRYAILTSQNFPKESGDHSELVFELLYSKDKNQLNNVLTNLDELIAQVTEQALDAVRQYTEFNI